MGLSTVTVKLVSIDGIMHVAHSTGTEPVDSAYEAINLIVKVCNSINALLCYHFCLILNAIFNFHICKHLALSMVKYLVHILHYYNGVYRPTYMKKNIHCFVSCS